MDSVRIPVGVDCIVLVNGEWRGFTAVDAIVGPPDRRVRDTANDSALIQAKVLGADDPLGLWIELNTERKRFPDMPVSRFLIPWRFVLGVCVDDPEVKVTADPKKRFGFAQEQVAVTTITMPRDSVREL